MKLQELQLELQWPETVALVELRLWLLNQLMMHGEPLRWAITSVKVPSAIGCFRTLRVEAIVILPD